MKSFYHLIKDKISKKDLEELCQPEENPSNTQILKCKRCQNTNILLMESDTDDQLGHSCSRCNQQLIDCDGKPTQWCYIAPQHHPSRRFH